MSSSDRLAATIVVLRGRICAGDKMRYRIKNTGSIELICGLGYRLERKASEGWIVMNQGMAFRAIGFGLRPDGSRDLEATIPADAPAGSYRISTSVTSDHVAETLRLSADFDVEPATPAPRPA